MIIKNEIDGLTSFLEEVEGYITDAAYRGLQAELDLVGAEDLFEEVLVEIEDLKIVQLCLTGK